MRRRALLVCAFIAAAPLALGGCFDPAPPSGTLTCSSFGECPRGYHCAWDHGCWRDGEDPSAQRDLGGARDLASPAGEDLATVDLGASDLAPGELGAADLSTTD